MKVIKTAGVILGLVAVLALGLGTAALAGDHPPGGDKIYICHASGQAGTTKFETLYLPPAGVAAHFENNGTPKAGHELDYFGPCNEEPPPTDYCDTLPGVQGEDEDCPPPVTQPIEVTAGVTFTEATCTTGPSFHLVKSTGIPFYDVEGPLVDGKPVAGGTYTITALPAEGYVVVGQSVWVHTFAAAPTDCGGTPPPPRLCPDGKPPTPGEGAYDPNDDCARPPAPPVTTLDAPGHGCPACGSPADDDHDASGDNARDHHSGDEAQGTRSRRRRSRRSPRRRSRTSPR